MVTNALDILAIAIAEMTKSLVKTMDTIVVPLTMSLAIKKRALIRQLMSSAQKEKSFLGTPFVRIKDSVPFQ